MMLDELTYNLQDLIDKLERQMAERVGLKLYKQMEGFTKLFFTTSVI